MGKDIIRFEETRSWKYPEEESYKALCFSFRGKESERFMLVKDARVFGLWNVHFCCSCEDALSELEKNALVESIVSYIKPGEYLGTCGFSTRGEETGFKRFSYRTKSFRDTGCVRVLKDKWDGHSTYFPILQRL